LVFVPVVVGIVEVVGRFVVVFVGIVAEELLQIQTNGIGRQS